ncbi:helicase-associated domain-containing protein [Acidobacteria bacterium AH-259-L09]|nr:helicase-associated domain-containing protein [Acidobacteria bacterium AH-259-L09]
MKRHHVDNWIPTLATALSEYRNVDELKKLVLLTGSRAPTRKAELVELIVGHLEGDRLRTVWQSLDQLQRAAVAEVVHSGGTTFSADCFRSKYGRDPAWGSINGYRRNEKPTPLRFFFYGNGVMPADLKKRLKAFVPRPAKAKVKSLDQLPAAYDRPYEHWNGKTRKTEKGTEAVPLTLRESERPAQRELRSILRLVDAGKVAVSDKTRKPTTATIKAITAILEDGDFYPYEPPTDRYCDRNAGPIRSFAWPLIVQAGKLAQLSGRRLRLTKAGRKALSEPAADTIRRLWAKWTDTTILDELSRIDCLKGQTGKGKRGLTAVASRRDAVSATLGGCPEQRWIATEEFFRFIRASKGGFAVTRNAWNLYIGELRYGSLGYDNGERILDERYLLCLLLEYAATLGLVDVAFIPPEGARRDYLSIWGTGDLPYFSRYDGLMFFRINALGAYCLGMESAYTPAPIEVKPVLRVLSNLEIAGIGEGLEQGDRLALDTYGVSVSDVVWKLDASKLLSAVDQGRSVAEVQEFLEARSGAPLPDTVIRLLKDSANRCARIHDRGMARLVECDEPSLAAFIANDSRTRKYCMRAGERHLVVPASSESAFRRRLRDVGYLLSAGEPLTPKPRRAKRAKGSDARPSEA